MAENRTGATAQEQQVQGTGGQGEFCRLPLDAIIVEERR